MTASGPVSTAIFDSVQGNFIIRIGYDASGNVIYKGWALPNTADSELRWRIVKFTYDANNHLTDINFLSASPSFIHSWDLRASYGIVPPT